MGFLLPVKTCKTHISQQTIYVKHVKHRWVHSKFMLTHWFLRNVRVIFTMTSCHKHFQHLGPVSLTYFARNSNSIETSSCCNSFAGHQIAIKICTCYHSSAVVLCTNFCRDHPIRIQVRVKQNFHRIWIAMKKQLVKRGPGPLLLTWINFNTSMDK